MITAERVRSLLRYDPETGYLYWREAKRGVWKGARAGGVRITDGYIQIGIDKHRYLAHRVIWLMETDDWPAEQIDHINGVRHDNRWANLRAVTNQENQMNRKISNSTSGCVGVCWHKQNGYWRAHIKVDQRQLHIGVYEDWLDAVCARKAAEVEHGFHPNHGGAGR